jgi:hypothetical protein
MELCQYVLCRLEFQCLHYDVFYDWSRDPTYISLVSIIDYPTEWCVRVSDHLLIGYNVPNIFRGCCKTLVPTYGLLLNYRCLCLERQVECNNTSINYQSTDCSNLFSYNSVLFTSYLYIIARWNNILNVRFLDLYEDASKLFNYIR